MTSSSSPSDGSLLEPSEEEEDCDGNGSDSEQSDASSNREERLVRDKKFLLFESSLNELVKIIWCESCQMPAEVRKVSRKLW